MNKLAENGISLTYCYEARARMAMEQRLLKIASGITAQTENDKSGSNSKNNSLMSWSEHHL